MKPCINPLQKVGTKSGTSSKRHIFWELRARPILTLLHFAEKLQQQHFVVAR
jgi:hypothetical protein